MWDLNVKSTFFTIKEAVPLLEKGLHPNILIMSSVAAKNPGMLVGVYSMTKAVMNSMTEVLAFELRHEGIRVNALAPGIIKTNFAKSLWENPAVDKSTIGTPEQCASFAAAICSDDGSWCNGEVYYLHGGFAKI